MFYSLLSLLYKFDQIKTASPHGLLANIYLEEIANLLISFTWISLTFIFCFQGKSLSWTRAYLYGMTSSFPPPTIPRRQSSSLTRRSRREGRCPSAAMASAPARKVSQQIYKKRKLIQMLYMKLSFLLNVILLLSAPIDIRHLD